MALDRYNNGTEHNRLMGSQPSHLGKIRPSKALLYITLEHPNKIEIHDNILSRLQITLPSTTGVQISSN
jgi:hypothetical protein